MVEHKVFEILNEHMRRLKKAQATVDDPDGRVITYKPFFSSLTAKNEKVFGMDIRDGSTNVILKPQRPSYSGRIEMRMGDYEKGGAVNYEVFDLPGDLERDACLRELWLQSNEGFWDAVSNYDDMLSFTRGKKSKRDDFYYLSREEAIKDICRDEPFPVDLESLEQKMKQLSRHLASHPKMLHGDVDVVFKNSERYLVNSEGSQIYTNFVRYSMSMTVFAVDNEDRVIPNSITFHGTDMDKFPSLDFLLEQGEKLVKDVVDISKAPLQKNGEFPVILCPGNHGVLWHEVVGHALEGHRLQEDGWGDVASLFHGKTGEIVAPEFLSLYDDPTRSDLDGHYQYDEEGVPAQRVELIKDGRLMDFLHSRESAAFFEKRSNGHARASGNNEPCPRMSNIMIESSNAVSPEELRENLIKLVVDQGREYGLILEGTYGGMTMPEDSMFEMYPTHVHRLFPNGKMQRVQGVYIVGTPYKTLRDIVQTSTTFGVFNGTCGAESGYVPSTETAPEALVESLEINRIPNSSYEQLRTPVLPKPRINKIKKK